MSVATLWQGFMAWPPTVDRAAALPLASVPDRPRDTNTCRARRRGRDRWKVPGAAARHRSPGDTSRGAFGSRTDVGSRARAARSDRLGGVVQSLEIIARRPDGHTGAAIG